MKQPTRLTRPGVASVHPVATATVPVYRSWSTRRAQLASPIFTDFCTFCFFDQKA